MTLIPHRTVAGQIAAQLRGEVERGAWRDWLPSERDLSRTLQASRNTVRAALAQLKAEGHLAPVRGLGNRIVPRGAAKVAAPESRSVGVLIPEPIGRLRPHIALWIDELKDLLIEEGLRLRLHDGRQYYQGKPDRALARLSGQHRHAAWVLTLSSEPMQRWFARQGLPCVVAGSVYAGVPLPCCDLDYRASCRHAAGVLLRLGHRRIALLNREERRAGDVDSELGFLAGAKSTARAEVRAEVAYHRDDAVSVGRALQRLLDQPAPPTGIVVCNSYAYLSAISWLAQRGLRVPRDLSLISRDDDPFLTALTPTPARYVAAPRVFATRILGLLLRWVNGRTGADRATQLLPRYVAGGSTAAL